jgi:hypothetical protein
MRFESMPGPLQSDVGNKVHVYGLAKKVIAPKDQ